MKYNLMFLVVLTMGLVQAMEPDVNKLSDSTVLLEDSLEDFDDLGADALGITEKIERSNRALKAYQDASKDLATKMAKLKQLQEKSINSDELANAMHESDIANKDVQSKRAEYDKVRIPKIVSDDNESPKNSNGKQQLPALRLPPSLPRKDAECNLDSDNDVELEEMHARYMQDLLDQENLTSGSSVTPHSPSAPNKQRINLRRFKDFIMNDKTPIGVTSLVLIGISALVIYYKTERSQAKVEESQ